MDMYVRSNEQQNITFMGFIRVNTKTLVRFYARQIICPRLNYNISHIRKIATEKSFFLYVALPGPRPVVMKATFLVQLAFYLL